MRKGKNMSSFEKVSFETSFVESTCLVCGEPQKGVLFNGKVIRATCPDCQSDLSQTKETDIKESAWREICPSEFRFTDTEHRSWKDNLEAIEKVIAWKFTPEGRGMVIGGLSGKCKTRSVWKLLKPLHMRGVPFMAITETQFANDCGAKFAFGAIEGKQWIEELCKVPLLFLDDIGKSASTQRFSHEMFHVIDKRTSWRKPIIATLNASGKELAVKLGESGPQIVRRLKDYCDVITF